MNEVLQFVIGVLLGVLASVPVAMVIAASTRPQTLYLPRYFQDTNRTDVTVEPPSTAVVIFDPETSEVL